MRWVDCWGLGAGGKGPRSIYEQVDKGYNLIHGQKSQKSSDTCSRVWDPVFTADQGYAEGDDAFGGQAGDSICG